MVRMKRSRKCLKEVLLLLALFITAAPALAVTWQASFSPFFHTQSFTGTVSSGQEDAGIEYASGERRVRVEGSYLKWTQTAINYMVANIYCRDHGCGNWSQVASTYHAFVKNTNTFTNLTWKGSGWASSNLPGVSFSSEHSGGELRAYIGAPASMSASATYYSQMAYKDTAYPGTKTNAQVVYSTYEVILGGIPAPLYRDDNARLCVNNDTVTLPSNKTSSGSCS